MAILLLKFKVKWFWKFFELSGKKNVHKFCFGYWILCFYLVLKHFCMFTFLEWKLKKYKITKICFFPEKSVIVEIVLKLKGIKMIIWNFSIQFLKNCLFSVLINSSTNGFTLSSHLSIHSDKNHFLSPSYKVELLFHKKSI